MAKLSIVPSHFRVQLLSARKCGPPLSSQHTLPPPSEYQQLRLSTVTTCWLTQSPREHPNTAIQNETLEGLYQVIILP